MSWSWKIGQGVKVYSAGSAFEDEAAWQSGMKIDIMGAVNSFDAALPFPEKAAVAFGDASFVMISSVSAAVAGKEIGVKKYVVRLSADERE